jgi:CRP-like cAMP-binding protein
MYNARYPMAKPPSLSHTLTILRKLPLLAQLPEDALEDLARKCTLSRYEPDETIFYQADPIELVHIVREGQVKIVVHEEDGREAIIEMISPGEPFGGGAIYLSRQPATARAATRAEVLSFTVQFYEAFLLAHPTAALRLIRMLGHRLYGMRSLNVLVGERVERRLAHILLKLAGRAGRPHEDGTLIGLSLSRQDLADMSGTTIETVIRIMSRLRKKGIVKTLQGGYVLILDQDELLKLSKPKSPD